MANLVLYTASFPFGKKETYLETEIKYLSDKFDNVYIFPLYYNEKNKIKRQVPENVFVTNPPTPTSKLLRLILVILRSIKHFSAIKIFIQDAINNKVYKSRTKIKRMLLDLAEYAIIVGSKQFKSSIEKSDCIHYFYWGTGWSNAIVGIPENNKIFTFVRLHGGDTFLERSDGYIPLRREVFKKATRIISSSRLIKDYLIDRYNCDENKIFISRLGVKDFGVNNIDSNSKIIRIVSSSNVCSIKRVDIILNVLKWTSGVLVEWHHFGDGPLFDDLKEKSKRLPTNVQVFLHGWVSNNQLLDFYSKVGVDAFFNVSKYEGLPVSIMEAMSFGIPIVATNVGATSELVSQDNGLLINEDISDSELAKYIVKFKSPEWINKRAISRSKWKEMVNAEVNYVRLAKFLSGEILR